MPEPLMHSELTPDADHARRFGGIARLYGDAGLQRLSQAHICVIGVGGVGSWVVESLARSAVGRLTLIDMDMVALSNVNRQILATSETVGRDKIRVLQDRVKQINPQCAVELVDDFIRPENVADLLCSRFDYVVDCIDDFRCKAALIAHCRVAKIKVITVGGAGGQIDPTKIRQSDLSRTQHDVLLARTRKLLRQSYGLPRNPKRSFGVPCVYSDEQLVFPDGAGGVSLQRPLPSGDGSQSNALSCAGGLGSITHVTATFGLLAAGYILNALAHEGD
ncbi:tRNA cyclic N6-threonylcarbamoyladenosine(37) synthase TcdA [Arenicella chitinivorans]|nr:tRNA cyclic N6-threonylcarbamoyladenosine(37) synthase TcdA [Arenicella chitinivorans]